MTNEEKLQYIKSKVIEVCPEVMELGFGCEFMNKKSNRKCMVIGETLYFGGDGDYELILFIYQDKAKEPLLFQEGSKTIYNTKYEPLVGEMEMKILGHPITLSHILRTLKVPEQRDKNPDDTYQLFGGYIHSWNMEKDSLDQQKPEVIDFLYALLK